MTRLARCSAILLLCSASALAAELPTRRPRKKPWLLSCAAVAAVNALDIYSARGLGEANPLFRNPEGRFATRKAALLKSAITGGFFAVQYGLMRANPDKDYFQAFTVANTVTAGSLGAVVIHNYTLPASQRPLPAHPAPAQ